MARIAYVDGRYLPIDAPAIRIEDRGYQFSDAVYEVCLMTDGKLWDAAGHFARLGRSLDMLNIPSPMSDRALLAVFRETARRNRLRDTLIYLQVSRGVGPRDHAGDWSTMAPVVVVTARRFSMVDADRKAARGIAVVTRPDERWARPDIKTVSLLANILAKAEARDAGAGEAWLVKDGFVTEASRSNAWIVTRDGALVTRRADRSILAGITRAALIGSASPDRTIEERPFSVDEAKTAAEAFITSATALVTPVVSIDGAPVGDGRPGPVAAALREAYKARAGAEAI